MFLSNDVYAKCEKTLLQCPEFDSSETLRAIFNVDKLAGYKVGLPDGKTRAERVNAIIDYLLEKRYQGEFIFIIFLKVLAYRRPDGDELREDLLGLITEVQNQLAATYQKKKLSEEIVPIKITSTPQPVINLKQFILVPLLIVFFVILVIIIVNVLGRKSEPDYSTPTAIINTPTFTADGATLPVPTPTLHTNGTWQLDPTIHLGAALNIAVDLQGNLYVADERNRQICKFDSNGKLLATWNSTIGHFTGILNIAVDSQQNLYVINVGDTYIQKFSSDGKPATKIGTGDNLQYPQKIWVDKQGTVYVIDHIRDNSIRGHDVLLKLPTLTLWKIDDPSQYGSFFKVVVSEQGDVYIADQEKHQVEKFDSNGKILLKWGTDGVGEGQFKGILDIAIDNSGNVYISDTDIPYIQEFDKDGRFLAKLGINTNLHSPQQVVLDRQGNSYIVDNIGPVKTDAQNRIVKVQAGASQINSIQSTPNATLLPENFGQGITSINTSQIQFWFTPTTILQIVSVDVHYTLNGSELQNKTMIHSNSTWQFTVNNFSNGDRITYFFTYSTSENIGHDTRWFSYSNDSLVNSTTPTAAIGCPKLDKQQLYDTFGNTDIIFSADATESCAYELKRIGAAPEEVICPSGWMCNLTIVDPGVLLVTKGHGQKIVAYGASFRYISAYLTKDPKDDIGNYCTFLIKTKNNEQNIKNGTQVTGGDQQAKCALSTPTLGH
jgi:streptogramin lyase